MMVFDIENSFILVNIWI